LISRAWEKASNESIAIPTKATKPAMAPTWVNEFVSESARGRVLTAYRWLEKNS
jgi:energy-coupling factor transporter transmembrane protein EcfT